jgi:type IV secretory pathway ATPase VirB11/archaellum biosynthesis ATPase
MLEHRASIIIAAEPPLAGKTTILTALIDFLRPQVQRLYLRGWSEDYDFVGSVEPGQCYLLVNEMSDHLPVYMWGRPAMRLFELLPLGFGMAATMHADTAEEVVGILTQELRIPRPLIGNLAMVLNLRVIHRGQQNDGVIRRTNAVRPPCRCR